MKAPSFLVKVAVGNLLAVAAVMSLVSTLTYRSLDEHFQAENRTSQERSLKWFQKHFEDLWPLAPEAVARQCIDLARNSATRITVVAGDGSVLGDSEKSPVEMKNHRTSDRPEIMGALEGRLGEASRVSDTVGTSFRYMALPIRAGGDDGKIVAVVRTAIPIRSIADQSAFIRGVVWWSSLAAVFATAILALLLAYWWYIPLRQVTQTARSIAAGNLEIRARGSWTAELSELAAALNEMRRNLSQQISLAQAQREDLRTVIANTREGILATDAGGKIVLANRSAVEMLTRGADDPIGKPLSVATDVLEVADAFNQAMSLAETVQKQVEAQRQGKKRVLDVHAIPLGKRDNGISGLLVAYDITDIIQAASIRAEFAANASHELRTPLAILRGSVEALARIGPADQDAHTKFVRMLDRQVKRLEDLTRDLLSLHAIESGKVGVKKEAVELGDLAQWAQESFSPRARDKGVNLSINAGDPSAVVMSDVNLLEIILQNLLDNALKFTPAGGKVECSLSLDRNAFAISVSDTGCGIPAELQSRVFERFFQVDPGRSGDPSERGTGLGLAIVKHAAERLGAKVELRSQVGQGTTVAFIVPQAG